MFSLARPYDVAAMMGHPESVRRMELAKPAAVGSDFSAHRTCFVLKDKYNLDHMLLGETLYEDPWHETISREFGILGEHAVDVWDDAPYGGFPHRIPGHFRVYVCGPLRGTINNVVSFSRV